MKMVIRELRGCNARHNSHLPTMLVEGKKFYDFFDGLSASPQPARIFLLQSRLY